jgi:hypothetical protein
MGSSFTWAQPATGADNPGLHLGWDNKPNHVEILTQPVSQTVVLGQGVTLAVDAVGKPAKLHYAWKKDGMPVGGDAPTLAIGAATPDLAGAYTVTVSNPTGSVTSVPAILTVNVPPVITSQPVSQTIPQGASATFSVSASGSGTLGFHWRKGGTPLAGATSATLSLPAVTPADAGSFDVLVTNTVNGIVTSTTSQAAVLWVNVPPVITTNPVSQTVDLGHGATFDVAATSAYGGTLSYQWRKDGQPLAGATSSTFSIAGVTGHDAGS